MIHLFRPDVGVREMMAAARVIHSRWIGKGPVVRRFVQAWADHLGVPVGNLLPVASASDALCLTMELLDIKSGDEVIIPSVHFVAAANAVLRRGAKPVFCDVDRHTLNTDARYVKAKVTGKTKAIMVLHYGGSPCDMQPIQELGFPVIEDAAVAVGANYRGRACGTVACMGVWSFDAMKTISAGAGGMLWCRVGMDRARSLIGLGVSQQHGINSEEERWWTYELGEPGRLSEMNDITAALALAQLGKLEANLKRRQAICGLYDSCLQHLVRVPRTIDAPNFYWIQTERRDDLARFLRERGIYTSFRYWPLHLALDTGDSLPGAEWAAEHTLLLPLHSALTWRKVRRVCSAVREFHD